MPIECKTCQASNRDIAKYCKKCGFAFDLKINFVASDFDDLIGLQEIKSKINNIVTVATRMKKSERQYDTKALHTILIGNTGTAKSKLAEIVAKIYFKNGIIEKPETKLVNSVDFGSFSKDLSQNINAAKGGILFIDEVHRLVPSDYIPGTITPIDRLYVEMDKLNGNPIVILASKLEGFKEYLDKNPDVKSRFNLIFTLPDLTADEMLEIANLEFKKQKFTLSTSAEFKLGKLFKNIVKKKDSNFGNGHKVNQIVKEIIDEHFINAFYDNHPNTIQDEDIKGEIDLEKTTAQIFDELDAFVGMNDVKLYIKNLIERIQISKKDAEKTGKKYSFGEHLILTGNPGTGKTSLARKLGEIMVSVGLLSRGQVIETDRSKLVGQYVGATAPLVQKLCDDAIGGILFIDEAYTLKQHDNDIYGQEAIDTLLKRMEDDRGKLMVIAAGYKNEMKGFIEANPGLKSRFKEENIFELKDYQPDELVEIFKIFLTKDNYVLHEEAESKLKSCLENIYYKRDKSFGNGREVRNFYEKCLSTRAKRLQKDTSNEHDLVIYAEDILIDDDSIKTITLADALSELENLVGLNSVKEKISDLIDFLEVEKIRSNEGGKNTSINIHFVFKGNPGTGKTTVARILANIFKTMGLLTKGQLVETDRKDLVAEFVGQTAPKTNKVIESALGGVLFIDEAYTLSTGGVSDFGKEAIDTLLKRMEDDRGKLIVIAAGYNADMEKFLNSNPGLTSRFTYHVQFDDYTPEEMVAIFGSMVKSKGMKISNESDDFIVKYFSEIYLNRDKNFANGRTVRNVFEKVLQSQAKRLSVEKKKGVNVVEKINIITKEDFN